MELELTSVQIEFPLEDLLKAFDELRKIKLRYENACMVTGDLECVAKHASQVTVFSLDPVDYSGGFAHVWEQEISIHKQGVYESTSDFYRELAHAASRLRKLNLDYFDIYAHLLAATYLFQEIVLGQVKEACPQVSIHLICSNENVLV